MYGRNYDDFAYRGIQFRWVLSPNRFIYRVYREQELIGTIPVSQVRTRMLPEAIAALYPICDAWIDRAEEAELVPIIQAARLEWQEKGGRPWQEVAEGIPIFGAPLTENQMAVKRQEIVDELLSPDDPISEYVLKAAAIEIATAKKKRATKREMVARKKKG